MNKLYCFYLLSDKVILDPKKINDADSYVTSTSVDADSRQSDIDLMEFSTLKDTTETDATNTTENLHESVLNKEKPKDVEAISGVSSGVPNTDSYSEINDVFMQFFSNEANMDSGKHLIPIIFLLPPNAKQLIL